MEVEAERGGMGLEYEADQIQTHISQFLNNSYAS